MLKPEGDLRPHRGQIYEAKARDVTLITASKSSVLPLLAISSLLIGNRNRRSAEYCTSEIITGRFKPPAFSLLIHLAISAGPLEAIPFRTYINHSPAS